jgi:cytochrome c oxidase subunit IV
MLSSEGASSQAPIIVFRIVGNTVDEMVLSDSARVSGFFFGIAIVIFCVLSATVIVVFGMFATTDQLAIYYQAFFDPFFVFSGMLFIVGVYLLLSISEKRLLFSKASGRILVNSKTLWRTRTLATYSINDAQRIEWRIKNGMEKINDGKGGYAHGAALGILIRQALLKPQNVLVSQAVIVLKNGSELLLASAKALPTGQVFGNIKSSISVVEEVASFLGISVEGEENLR